MIIYPSTTSENMNLIHPEKTTQLNQKDNFSFYRNLRLTNYFPLWGKLTLIR